MRRCPYLQRNIDNVDVSLAARAADSSAGVQNLARLVQLVIVAAFNIGEAQELTDAVMKLSEASQSCLMMLIEEGMAAVGLAVDDDAGAAGAPAPAPSDEPVTSSSRDACGMTPSRKRARTGLTPAKLRTMGTPNRFAAAAGSLPPTGRLSISGRSNSFDSVSMGDDGGSSVFTGRPSIVPGGIRAATGSFAAAALERENAALREELVSRRPSATKQLLTRQWGAPPATIDSILTRSFV